MSILVVDDEKDLADALVYTLQFPNSTTTACYSAEEALNLLDSGKYDIVISDIRMPEMDGFTLLKTIKKQHKNIAVFLMTGYADHSKQEVFEAGAYGLFKKPDDLEHLAHKIKDFIEKNH